MKSSTLKTIASVLEQADRKDLADKIVSQDNYDSYFENKMKEFKVTTINELTPAQWEEIDKGWKENNTN